MDELEARVAGLPDPPTRRPAPLPPPNAGDAAVDALFSALDQPPHSHGGKINAALAELLERPPSDAIARTATAWLDAIGADPAPSQPPEGFARSRDEQLRLGTLIYGVRLEWGARSALAGKLCSLLLRHEREVHRTLVRCHSAYPHLAGILHEPLMTSVPPAGPARAAALAGLAAHLDPGDHRAAAAAEALVLRDGFGAAPSLRAFLDASVDERERAEVAVRVSKRKPEVDYDAEPGWIDVLFPNVVHLGAAIELLYPLHEVKTAEPLLRALAYSDAEPYWGDVLDDLRRVDDAASAERVEAIAATLPEAPKGSRLARSRGTVQALAKRLRRKRESVTRASFELTRGVSTDGGPILLVSRHAADAWKGVAPGWTGAPGPGQPEGDYDRACAASEEGIGALTVGGAAVLVLQEQAADFAALAYGEWLVVTLGTALQLEAALRERRAWKKTPLRLDVGDSGALLLDATCTVSSSSEVPGRSAILPMAPGRYDVLEVSRSDAQGAIRAWRLVPAEAEARRGGAKRGATGAVRKLSQA